MTRKLKTSGFTLIELLVVMSIVAILASVVLVALNTTKAKAYDSKFGSEIDSMKTALILYQSSNNDYPPLGNTGYTAGADSSQSDYSGSTGLQTFLKPYLVDTGYISKIPHYNGWTAGTVDTTNPTTWITYVKNATSYVSRVYYYSCNPVSDANTVLGKAMLFIGYSGIFRTIPGSSASVSFCRGSTATNDCEGPFTGDPTEGSPSGTSVMCIPLN